jgi:hypothetical protein
MNSVKSDLLLASDLLESAQAALDARAKQLLNSSHPIVSTLDELIPLTRISARIAILAITVRETSREDYVSAGDAHRADCRRPWSSQQSAADNSPASSC